MGWVRAPSGEPVYQDDSGNVHLKDAAGEIQKVPVAKAAEMLEDKYSGFSAASAEDLNAAHAEAEAAKSSKLGAAARHLAVGVAGGVLAPGKLASGLATAGINALGGNVEDPLRNISGRQVVNDLTAIGAHVTGGESELAAREQREQLARDEAEHPYISGAAELAGNVIGSAPIAGGEAALAERAAQGVGLAGKAAGVASRVGASVLEGAGLGADAASEQAWVKNTPVTAEQTLAGIGLGALFGGAGAAVGEVAGPALRKLLKRGAAEEAPGIEAAAVGEPLAEAGAAGEATALAPATPEPPGALETVSESRIDKARKWMSGMSDEMRVDAISRGNKPAMRRLGNGEEPSREFIRDTGKTLHEMGVTGNSESEMYDQVVKAKELAGNRIGAVLDGLDATAGEAAAPKIENALAQVRAKVTKMRNSAKLGSEERLANSLEAEVAPLARQADARMAWNREAKKAMRGADDLLTQIEASPSAGNRAFAAKLRASVDGAQKAIEGGYADATHLQPVTELLGSLQSAPSATIRKSAGELLAYTDEVASRADAAPRMTFRDLHSIRGGVDAAAYEAGMVSPRLREELKGVRGILESEINRAMGEYDPQALAEYTLNKRRYQAGSWAEDTLGERVGIRNHANREFSLTDYKAGIGGLLASGGNPLLGLASMTGNKLLRERGMATGASIFRRLASQGVDVAAAPAGATNTARALQTMIARSESHIQDGLGRYLGGETIGAVGGASRKTAAKAIKSAVIGDAKMAYKDHASEVQNLAANPQLLANRLQNITGTKLPTVAPGLHVAMAAVASRAAQYLSSNLPAPPTDPDSITPQLDEAPPVSVADMRAYADRVEGVEDPLSLIDDLHEGDVSPEKVDAVKTVWPELFQRMRQTTFDNLAQRTEAQGPVPYEQRKLLDLALDGNGSLEPSLRADSLAVMKQAFQYQQQQLKQKAPRPSSGGSPKIGNMLATRSDQIASSR